MEGPTDIQHDSCVQDIDEFNDETFGDGAIEGDWETSHYIMTGDFHEGSSPQYPLHQQAKTNQDQEEFPDVTQLKINELKGLWPSSPQQSNLPFNSIWSSPELPLRKENISSSPSIPPGSKIMSVEELEREITESATTDISSMSPHLQPHPPPASSSSSSPAHMTSSPARIIPSPAHMIPPPGIIQNPPPGLPHPLPPRNVTQMVPWLSHMQGHGGHHHGPPHAFRPIIPPPNIPIVRHVRPGHQLPLPHFYQPHHPPFSHFPPHMHPQPLLNHPDFMPRKSKRSEYLDEMRKDGSGFMTQKEKDWVIKIQLVQIQSPDPENEDYYYQNFQKQKVLRDHQLSSDDISQHSDSDSSPQTRPKTRPLPHFTTRDYTPTKFSGALGKLTVSSITAPRKTIDVHLISESIGKEIGSAAMDTYMKKKQALMIIEKLYDAVLMLEGIEKKSKSATDDKESAELRAQKDELARKMFHLLKLKSARVMSTGSDDGVLQMVMNYYCKGRRVVRRILPFLDDDQACSVLLGILRHLPTVIRRDCNDQVLPQFSGSVLPLVSTLDLEMTNKCLSALLEGISSSSSANYVVRVCQNKFGADVLLALIEHGQEAKITEDEKLTMRWSAIIQQLHTVLTAHEEQLAGTQIIQHVRNLL